ncbi:septum formation initiator subfamily protein [Mycobacterium tuberculosis]|nr:septum formation initiator subfamily protein [Mycobacterium tuberculosis]
MPEAKRPESKRRSPASRPGKAGDSVRGGRATKPSAKPSTPAPHASRKTTRTPHEHIVEPIKRAITESVEKRSEQRLGFTARRAAILAAVVCVLTLTIARPVRTYFAQRAEMEQLAATEAMLRRQIADLEEQQVKLADPAYIAAQARERLGFVMPGDIPFQVQLPSTPLAPPNRGQTRLLRPTTNPGTPRCGTRSPTTRTCRLPRHRHRSPDVRARCRRPRQTPSSPVVDRADLEVVTRQLGRAPRGVLAIAYRCPNGEPGVVKTAPRLPDGTPFPTLYYLTHPVLTAAASRLETTGLMREMNRRLGQDAELAAAYRRAHESYLSERDALEPLGTTVSAGGMPDRVKCLHVLIAHSLAKGPGLNPFGDEALALLAAEPRTAATLVAGQWR